MTLDSMANKPFPKIITIDGPAASGKSTLGKRLADELEYLFFDTGVMYRAVTWLALQDGLEIEDEDRITLLADGTDIDVRAPSLDDGRQNDILADGRDITWQIRLTEVDANVSLVSSYGGVRDALTIQQRRIGQRGKVVMVGRDIGTVVLPDADLKIYLDASAVERARRRYYEQCERGEESDQALILEAMRKRDKFDSTREVAPLRAAPDAVIIFSDNMDADQVLQTALQLVHQRSL
jgi:cytidylate kinase